MKGYIEKGLEGSQQLLSFGAGCVTLLDGCVHQPRCAPSLRDFMEASSCRRDPSLVPFPARLPSPEDGDGAQNPMLLMAWSFC